jgi:hypothetical protein
MQKRVRKAKPRRRKTKKARKAKRGVRKNRAVVLIG